MLASSTIFSANYIGDWTGTVYSSNMNGDTTHANLNLHQSNDTIRGLYYRQDMSTGIYTIFATLSADSLHGFLLSDHLDTTHINGPIELRNDSIFFQFESKAVPSKMIYTSFKRTSAETRTLIVNYHYTGTSTTGVELVLFATSKEVFSEDAQPFYSVKSASNKGQFVIPGIQQDSVFAALIVNFDMMASYFADIPISATVYGDVENEIAEKIDMTASETVSIAMPFDDSYQYLFRASCPGGKLALLDTMPLGYYPSSMASDQDGNILVCNGAVYRYDKDLSLIDTLKKAGAMHENVYEIACNSQNQIIGSNYSTITLYTPTMEPIASIPEPGPTNSAPRIAVGANDTVYIACDSALYKFSPDLSTMIDSISYKQLAKDCPAIDGLRPYVNTMAFDNDGNIVLGINTSSGKYNRLLYYTPQFVYQKELWQEWLATKPVGLAVDENGFTYISDRYTHVVSVFDADGNLYASTYYRKIEGGKDGAMSYPEHALLANGKLYVLERAQARRISVFERAKPLSCRVDITIVGTDGLPIENATLLFNGQHYTTDNQGIATVRDLATGTYAYQAQADGYNPTHGTIDIRQSATTKKITLQALAYSATFSVNDGATPIENATLTINATKYATDAKGEIALQLTAGTYAYSLSAFGYLPMSGTITIAGDTITKPFSLQAYTLSGTASISGNETPQFGDTLQVSVANYTGTVPADSIQYRWYLFDGTSSSAIENQATGAIKLQADAINAYLFCILFANNSADTLKTDTTAIIAKADQAPPQKAELHRKTATSITLKARQGVRYSIDRQAWQESPLFEGLSPETEYTFLLYCPETATHNASQPSQPATFATLAQPAYTLAITVKDGENGIAGASIGTGQSKTDDSGMSQLSLAPGKYTLDISAPAYKTLQASIAMPGKDTAILVTMERVYTVDREIVDTACGDYKLNGRSIATSGIYADTIKGASSFEITNANITIHPVYARYDTIAVEFGQTYQFGNQMLDSSGNYTTIFTTDAGCDSTVMLAFSVHDKPEAIKRTLTDTACGQYLFAGQTISKSGIYCDTVTNANGADTIVMLSLTVHPVYTIYDTVTVEFGQTYLLGGQMIDSSGTYTATFPTDAGCDSTVVLALLVKDKPGAVEQNITATACGQYYFADDTITQGGVYRDTIPNANGADTIVILSLTVHPGYTVYDTIAVAFGQTYLFGNQLLDSSGAYTATFATGAGCDSTVVLAFSVQDKQGGSSNDSVVNSGDSVLTFTIAENPRKGTSIAYLPPTDKDGNDLAYILTDTAIFTVANDSIAIKDTSAFDAEATDSIFLTVYILHGSHTDSATIAIAVANSNEKPAIAIGALHIAENPSMNAFIADLPKTDQDGDTLTYSLRDSIAVTIANGTLSVADSSAFDAEKGTVAIDLIVSDGTFSDTIPLLISVQNINDNAPSIATIANPFSIVEHSATGTEIGQIHATDIDDDTVVYSLANNANAAIAIDSHTGMLYVADSALLDYETTPTIMAHIIVSDGLHQTNADISIMLTDWTEPIATAICGYAIATNVYPTCTDGEITVSVPDYDAFVSIISANGTVCVQAPIANSETLDLSELPSGIYLVCVATNGATQWHSVVKR